MDAGQIVDLKRYPIVNLGAVAGRALVDTCRRDLDDHSICSLPGFIRPNVMPALVAEARNPGPQGLP